MARRPTTGTATPSTTTPPIWRSGSRRDLRLAQVQPPPRRPVQPGDGVGPSLHHGGDMGALPPPCHARLDGPARTAEPDYSAIARMEMESFGRTFEHAGAPSGQSASGTYAILRVTCNQGHDGRMWADGRGKTCPKCETRRGAFGTLNAMRRERRS